MPEDEATQQITPHDRIPALDVARGCAVVGMIFVHLVPAEGGNTGVETFCAAAAAFLEGKAAALFCILAGMSWGIQAQRSGESPHYTRYLLRRALALAVAGILLHLWIWKTEILLPLALMMPLCTVCFRRGQNAVRLLILCLLIAQPLAVRLFGDFIIGDWNDNGLHLADSSLGWHTLRYLVFDGNYPLLPWMVFPLVGMLLSARIQQPLSKHKRDFTLAFSLTVASHIYSWWIRAHPDMLGIYVIDLGVTWIPTTLPFLLLTGSSAVVVITGLLWWQTSLGLPRPASFLALLGRASLTHYLFHLVIVFVPLRLHSADEQWSVTVGLRAVLLYFLLALPISVFWFRHFSRGPLESLWAHLSGPSR